MASALHMTEPKTFRAIARVRRDEWAWAIVTVVGVVLIGTLDGILIAVTAQNTWPMPKYHRRLPP